MSRDVAILLEEGARVLAHQVIQEDPERGWRAVRGLMVNAGHQDEEGQ